MSKNIDSMVRRRLRLPGIARSPREVQVFIYRGGGRDGHQVLVFHRAPEHGAYWHTVAGAVEGPETGAEAAVRELREETGLNPAERVVELGHCYRYPIEVEPPERRILYSADVRAIRGESFAIEVPAGWEPRLNAEHNGYQWCTLDEADRLVYWTETKVAIGVLGRRLRRPDAPR